VGGIAGGNAGRIVNCYANATTTAVSTGTEVSVGGIAGTHTGILADSYAISAVTGVASAGNVNVGGIAGKAQGILTGCLGINSTVSGSGQSIRSGKIAGYDQEADIINSFGFFGNNGWGVGNSNDGTPISGEETLYPDLYGPEGLNWDISEQADDSTAWLVDATAHYILPILRTVDGPVQKNQMLPDHLLYF
jgi:hypothetical protein